MQFYRQHYPAKQFSRLLISWQYPIFINTFVTDIPAVVLLRVLLTLCQKCLWFFRSVFSRIWIEYGDLQNKSPYSVQMRKMQIRQNPNTDSFYAV